MTPENFCEWLNGFFLLSGATSLTPKQVALIKAHLEMVQITEEHNKQSTSPYTDNLYRC